MKPVLGFCRAEGRTLAVRVCADGERNSGADYESQQAVRPLLVGPNRDWSVVRLLEPRRVVTVLRVQPTGNCSFLGAMYRHRKVHFTILREKFRNIPRFGRERERGRVVVFCL